MVFYHVEWVGMDRSRMKGFSDGFSNSVPLLSFNHVLFNYFRIVSDQLKESSGGAFWSISSSFPSFDCFLGHAKGRCKDSLCQANSLSDFLDVLAGKRLHRCNCDFCLSCNDLSFLVFDCLIQTLHDTFIYTHFLISCFCRPFSSMAITFAISFFSLSVRLSFSDFGYAVIK